MAATNKSLSQASVFAFIALTILLAACGVSKSSNSASDNALAVGPASKTSDSILIPTSFAENYNFKSKAEIYKLRASHVQEQPVLLGSEYSPRSSVFDLIEDNKPWWGLAGRSVWGPGQRSIEGLAEESRFLSNPFLLVGADPASAAIWNQDKITRDDLDNSNFPYAWRLKKLNWLPAQSKAEATYLVSDFNQALYIYRDKLKEPSIIPAFNLVAYNARDFGYDYIWLDEKTSTNIINSNHPAREPIKILQMIHCGGTCGFPGGCNNMSPSMPAIDRVKYTKLPAKATIRLWKNKPSSVDNVADFLFELNLE